jgi:SprT protein
MSDSLTEQMAFAFDQPMRAESPPEPDPIAEHDVDDTPLISGPATDLQNECRQLLLSLGLPNMQDLVRVEWNPRLRSTAGYAKYRSWTIELNPRLLAFEGEVNRTLRHELAHLVAHYRAGRRRIEPHGAEWQEACVQLGIPGESARHSLPLPKSKLARRWVYQCPSCAVQVRRVRPFSKPSACLACCRLHAGGKYDARFTFRRLAFAM